MMQPPLEMDALCAIGTLFHEIFLVTGVVSAICFVLTRSARRVGPGYIMAWLAGITAAITSWSLILIPDRVATIPVSIGTSLAQHMPDIALPFYKVAANLNPTGERLRDVASLQRRINHLQEALESLKKMPEEVTDSGRRTNVRSEKADLLMQLGRYDEALSVIGSIAKDMPAAGHRLMIKWNAKQGFFDKALADIQKWEIDSKKDPKTVAENFDVEKLDILLATKDYQKALDLSLSESMVEGSRSSYKEPAKNLLRGILFDKLNQHEKAKQYYRDALKGYSHYVDNYDRLGNRFGGAELLVVSYAYAMLGDAEKAKNYFKHAYSNEHSRFDQEQKFFGRSRTEAIRRMLAGHLDLTYSEKELPIPVEFSL